MQRFFGYSVSNTKGKPTNSEFIALIADRLLLQSRSRKLKSACYSSAPFLCTNSTCICALILHGSPNPKVLDPMVQTADGESIDESAEYTISQGSAKATGVVTSEGFVLLQGAEINEKVSAKSLNAGIVKLREKYISDGHVQNLVTTEDILFSSSSAAADFVLGYSVSGPKTWKAPDGRTLKEVEESKT